MWTVLVKGANGVAKMQTITLSNVDPDISCPLKQANN